MDILSELFSTFDAEPPIIIKKEKDESSKKHKKSKKKHKHKEKKHKKKSKKRKHSASSNSTCSELDLAEILIKKERECPEKKLKIDLNAMKQTEITTENEEKQPDTTLEQNNSNKIKIKTIKFSSIFNELQEKEYNESSEVEEKKKRKEKHHKHKKHKHRSRSNTKNDDSPEEEHDSKGKDCKKSKEYKEADKEKHKNHHKYKDSKLYDYKSRDHCRDYDDMKSYRYRENAFYKNEDRYSDIEDKLFNKDKYRSYNDRDRDKEKKYRDRSLSAERSSTHIDKKKLLEIARKNAIQMMKSGSLPGALNLGPQAQEKVIAAIKSGGKTIEELTDFCKSLSKQEEIGELSSISEDNISESDNDTPFHHPFQIKERPSSITMNIKNSVPLPLKTTQERASELRIQFPVSSGQQHRRTENEWVPVSPKKIEPVPIKPSPVVPTVIPTSIPQIPVVNPVPETQIAMVPPLPPGPQVFPPNNNLDQNIDIAAIVSQRLTAMRKLQENPHDVQAISQMYKAQKEMNTWAESKQQIGQFTGSTGAQILTQAQLNSGYQAWARKDQLQTAAPVSGGMGMHLLQKMGWKPGEGLGKEKTGTLEPLLLEVKLDKKGIVTKEEQKKKQPKQQKGTAAKVNTQGKHPVSLLGEYSSKQKLGAPQYSLCFECGPDHKKNFLFKVVLNGIEYKPNIASPNKKEAKANAASVCLQQLGLLPPPPPPTT